MLVAINEYAFAALKSYLIKIIDKKFMLRQIPNTNVKELDDLGNKVSIVNILPIYEYTIPPFLKKKRNRLIKRVK